MSATVRALSPNSESDELCEEASLVGILLLPATGAALASAAAVVGAEDFRSPAYGHVFAAICDLHRDGIEPDPVLVMDRLRRGGLDSYTTVSDLIDIAADAPSRSSAVRYAELVREKAIRRRSIGVAEVLRSGAIDPSSDIAGVLSGTLRSIEEFREQQAVTVGMPVPLAEFLTATDDEPEWVLHRLMARAERTVITGPEGGGKSTLLRQIGVQAAAGVRPFTLAPIPPVRVLLFDVENPQQLVRSKLRELRALIDDTDALDSHLFIEMAANVDLLDAHSAADFEAKVASVEPDLLIAGPLYKLAGGDPNEEATARAVVAVIDRVRARHGTAVILEAHTPHGAEERPYGASLWMRWPEVGFYLAPGGAIRHWRGQRDARDWPTALQRGTTWPWRPADQPPGAAWDGPTHCRAAVVRYLTDHPDELSLNALVDRLKANGSSYRKGTVSTAAEQLVESGELLARNGPRSSRLFRPAVPSDDPIF